MTKLELIVLDHYKLYAHGIKFWEVQSKDKIKQDEINLFGYLQHWISDAQRMKQEIAEQRAEQLRAQGK